MRSINYNVVADRINKKHGIDQHNYERKLYGDKDHSKLNWLRYMEWEKENFPQIYKHRSPEGNWKDSPDTKAFLNDPDKMKLVTMVRIIWTHILPDGGQKDTPHLNFWHRVLDYIWMKDPDFHNGSKLVMNFRELKDFLKPDWCKEICDLWIEELGEEDILVHHSW